jgi:hypothetical protein
MIGCVAGADDFATEVGRLCERLQVGLDTMSESHASSRKLS